MDWPDMRENINAFLNGDAYKKAEGQWCIYRRPLKGALTKNFDILHDESIGGEKFKYAHFMIRALFWPIGSTHGQTAEYYNKIGYIPKEGFLAMIQFDIARQKIVPRIRPDVGDSIFTIKGGTSPARPKKPFGFLQKYKVLTALSSAGDYGRDEGWILNIDNENTDH